MRLGRSKGDFLGSCGGISTLASYGCRNRTVFHTGIVAAGFCLFLGFQPHWLNQIYDLQGSANLANWQTLAANVVSPYLLHPHAAGMPAASFYRLAISGGLAPAPDGLDAWEEALYVQTFGGLPATRDSDGDGLNDAVEFQQGHLAGKKDHPAVGLVVFTPLEK